MQPDPLDRDRDLTRIGMAGSRSVADWQQAARQAGDTPPSRADCG
jgi:hypothetical protein